MRGDDERLRDQLSRVTAREVGDRLQVVLGVGVQASAYFGDRFLEPYCREHVLQRLVLAAGEQDAVAGGQRQAAGGGEGFECGELAFVVGAVIECGTEPAIGGKVFCDGGCVGGCIGMEWMGDDDCDAVRHVREVVGEQLVFAFRRARTCQRDEFG